MRILYLLFSLLLLTQTAAAQQNDLVITAEGVVELEADRIVFRVNINTEADSPQEAYTRHKQQERVLVQLLEKHDIGEKAIRFQPISIHKSDRRVRSGEMAEVIRTNQQVYLTLEDFDVYENIQVTLIKNGFDNFSGNFTSSEIEEGKKEALKKAIRQAKKNAQIIARESAIDLGGIREIHYGETRISHGQQQVMRVSAESDMGLMDYGQTVPVRASVTIHFKIQ